MADRDENAADTRPTARHIDGIDDIELIIRESLEVEPPRRTWPTGRPPYDIERRLIERGWIRD